jgi:hypothetical protein
MDAVLMKCAGQALQPATIKSQQRFQKRLYGCNNSFIHFNDMIEVLAHLQVLKSTPLVATISMVLLIERYAL